MWAGVSGIGVALGPMLGGILVEHFYWGAVFFVNVPICALALVLGYFFIPTSRDPDNRPLDPLGALLSIVTLVALLYAIIQAPEKGWLAPDVVVAFGASGSCCSRLFAWWETHTKEPMIDVRVFRNPRFSAASGVLTLTSFALYGSVFLLIQYFQFVLGYSPLEAGLLAMPVAVGMMVVSPNAPRFVLRWGTKRVVVIGLLVVAAADAAATAPTPIMSSFVGGCAVRLLFGIGLGLTSAPATESIMGSLPPSRAGVGSAINDTTRQTGGALGVAIIGSVFLAAYHHFADKAQHLSAASSAALHDSVGRALELARDLPAKQGAALRRARRARRSSTPCASPIPIAAAFIVFAAFIAWRYLPGARPGRVRDRRRLRRSARDQRVRDPRRVTRTRRTRAGWLGCVPAMGLAETAAQADGSYSNRVMRPRVPRSERRMEPEDRPDTTTPQAEIDPDLVLPTARRPPGIRPGILLAIALGGMLGTPARYAVGRVVHVSPDSFPWSTFVVNISGSLVLGILLTLILERWPPSRYLRPFAAIGFLGVYTTFSTYMVETDLLLKDGQAGVALAYVLGSLLVGLAAVYVGIVIGRLGSTGRGVRG